MSQKVDLRSHSVIDVSIEQVAALSSQNTLPEPTLDLERLQPSLSTIPPTAPITRKSTTQTIRAPLPAYSSDDPWNANPRFGSTPGSTSTPFSPGVDGLPNGATSSLAGTGLPNEWWKKQENIKISILGQQGFILNRYTVYEVASDVSCPRSFGIIRCTDSKFLWIAPTACCFTTIF